MIPWVLKGLKSRIKTTRYPEREETTPGVSPGLPHGGEYPEEQAQSLAACCPTVAISQLDHRLVVDYRRCVHCFRCARATPSPIDWQPGYEWAALRAAACSSELPLGGPNCSSELPLGGRPSGSSDLGPAFARSIHLLVVDAGDCGACLNEVKQLNSPYYNMHRLGFFITPTPRQAGVMLVVGPLTDHMRVPLQKAYDAMPAPKRVIAVGACALSGGVFGPSFVCGTGVGDLLPVDVEVPGNPPPPLAILHGLLVAVGRKPTAALMSGAAEISANTGPAVRAASGRFEGLKS